MTRRNIAIGIAVLAALSILLGAHGGSSLLEDTDTSVLLRAITARHAPFSWFLSDWPLQNHFYRPIPTLLFEIDRRLYGTGAWGYDLTNHLLASGCVLALFWFLAEILDDVLTAAFGAALFALWHGRLEGLAYDVLGIVILATLVVGAIRHRLNFRSYLPAVLVLLYLRVEALPLKSFSSRIVDWLPGRTASSMTVFALVALAAYARYERLGKRQVAEAARDPLAPPATRSSKARQSADPSRRPIWLACSIAACAGALACYEQAIMLPACLVAVAVAFRCWGYRPNWKWHGVFWLMLAGYFGLRYAVIPHGVSHYQRQQFRSSVEGPLDDVLMLVFPPLLTVQGLQISMESGWLAFLTDQPYVIALAWVSAATTVWQLRRSWVLATAGWTMSILAFLPMAFLKLFEHYYYWPAALRVVLIIALARVGWILTSIAWRPREAQAPPRLSPAPGSLPHP